MYLNQIFAVIGLSAVLCAAQAINISGVVKDSSGVGISGATVKLENANISTTTGSDGGFSLKNGSAAIESGSTNTNLRSNTIQICNGVLSIKVSGTWSISVSIHDITGKLLYNHKGIYGIGTYSFPAPLQTSGILLFRIRLGDIKYFFKTSPLGSFSIHQDLVKDGNSKLAKQATALDAFADVISVIKEGRLNYRDSIWNSDTTGIVVKLIPNAGNVADVDGNVYQTVRIGNQVWTVENWRSTKFADGSDIPIITNNTEWYSPDAPKYCWPENSIANKFKYGALYNWFVVNSGKLAPAGWRIPTDSDWTALENYLIINGFNWDSTTVGNKIAKSLAARTEWWKSQRTAGSPGNIQSRNNTSGLSAVPGGHRDSFGSFAGQGFIGAWWSATEYNVNSAWSRSINFENVPLDRGTSGKNVGLSVLLVRGI